MMELATEPSRLIAVSYEQGEPYEVSPRQAAVAMEQATSLLSKYVGPLAVTSPMPMCLEGADDPFNITDLSGPDMHGHGVLFTRRTCFYPGTEPQRYGASVLSWSGTGELLLSQTVVSVDIHGETDCTTAGKALYGLAHTYEDMNDHCEQPCCIMQHPGDTTDEQLAAMVQAGAPFCTDHSHKLGVASTVEFFERF